jgi:hypothetical protein
MGSPRPNMSIIDFELVVLVLLLVLGVALLRQWIRHHAELRPVRGWLIGAAMPALLFLAGYYALAAHMHAALGRWPENIGNHGFPPDLVAHADFWIDCFGCLLLSMVLCLIVGALSLGIRRWRRAMPYCVVYTLSFVTCLALMALAPKPFINWWWD